jgi:hypothetical protein
MKEMLNIFQVAGDEVIHADNLVSFADKPIAKMRPEKTCSACD